MKTKLLLLHGALGSQKQFSRITSLLKDSFDVYTLNFEGHGGVPANEDYSIPLFTTNVIQFLDKNKLQKVEVFGYSMGGYVALNLAKNYPDRVGAVVTLGTKFNWTKESAANEVKMLRPDIIEKKVPHFAKKLQEEHHPLDWKGVMNNTAQLMSNLGNGLAFDANDYKSISNPVILGIGTKDVMVSEEETRLVFQELPRASMVVLENLPHAIEKIEPTIIASYMKQSFQ